MSRRLLVLLGLLMAAGATRARGQDTVVVGVGGELSAPLGDSLRVPIFADLTKAGTHKLGSYTVRVSWNPGVLTFRNWLTGAFATPVVLSDSVAQGVLWASGISVEGKAGAFSLLDLDLSPFAAGSDSVRVQVTELSAAGTFADLLASTTVLTQNAAFCEGLGRWGDLDADKVANSRDALAILSNLVGLPVVGTFDLTLGDVDGDGLVNSRDALVLLSYAVGIDVPGQRVLLVAAGPCTGSVPQFSALPDTADLVVNQSTRVIVFGRDASGRLTALNGLQWSVDDARIAAVDLEGDVTGREPGATTLVAGIGPGAQVQIPVVVRARRGTWYVDAAKAKQASVYLGTQKFPFATPEYAFGVVSEGDTIRVAPGIVDYEYQAFCECFRVAAGLQVGVVVIGDTLPDGTRPLLRGTGTQTAFPWEGGLHGEIHNLVLVGFQRGVDLYGLRSLTTRNVEYRTRPGQGGYGISADGPVDSLRVINSRLIADTSRYAWEGISLGSGAGYVEVRNSRFENWSTGVYASGIDSLALVGSEFTNNYTGLEVENCGTIPLRAGLSGNRFTDNDYDEIYLDNVQRAGLDHNHILARTSDAIRVYGPQCYGDAPPLGAPSAPHAAQAATNGPILTMLGDSIRFRASFNSWLDVNDFDSVLVDSLWLESPADTAVYQYGSVDANYARFTNSQLLNLYSVGIYYSGRELVVDRTQFTGCTVCDWSNAYAIEAYVGNDSGPRVQLTNSSFYDVAYGIYSPSYGDRQGPMVVTGNTFDSVATALWLYGDSLAITDNVFTRVRDYALWASPALGPRPLVEAQVLRNQVTCAVVGYTSYGLRHDNGPVRFEDNTVQQCQWGLSALNGSYPLANVVFRSNTVMPDSVTGYRVGIRPDGKWRPTITGNRIVGGTYGMDVVLTDTATAVIDSNAVSATGVAAIELYNVSGPATGVRNNIGDNLQYGIYNNGGTGSRSFTLGRLVGNALYAIYNTASGTFGAQENWWGDPGGPGVGSADVVSGPVDASTPLGTVPTDVPALAPRWLPSIAGSAAAAGPRQASVQAPPPGSAAVPPFRDRHAEIERLRLEHRARRAARPQPQAQKPK